MWPKEKEGCVVCFCSFRAASSNKATIQTDWQCKRERRDTLPHVWVQFAKPSSQSDPLLNVYPSLAIFTFPHHLFGFQVLAKVLHGGWWGSPGGYGCQLDLAAWLWFSWWRVSLSCAWESKEGGWVRKPVHQLFMWRVGDWRWNKEERVSEANKKSITWCFFFSLFFHRGNFWSWRWPSSDKGLRNTANVTSKCSHFASI